MVITVCSAPMQLKLAIVLLLPIVVWTKSPSFKVDYDGNQFLLDGEPFRYISGSIHYFRIPREYWLDRLKKIRALGFNAIQFYIPWNIHEEYREQYSFDGNKNFTEFIELAASQGLWSIIRPGPYACTEIENGGIPWWIINDVKKLRSSDKAFTKEVTTWWNKLLPMIKPLLRNNGGSVLMVQIENEYGSYDACDRNYTTWLRDFVYNKLGNDVVIYTTDGGSDNFLKCGFVPNTLPTVDFGPGTNVSKAVADLRKYMPKGPLVNSEYYSGWLALWGQKENSLPSAASLVNTLAEMYELGFSVNFYMIHGGSNFEFTAGAEPNAPCLQSYDYTSPITENGDTDTDYYLALRDWISLLKSWKHSVLPIPPNIGKKAYGDIVLKHGGAFNEQKYEKCYPSKSPKSFEDISHPYGYVLYSHTLQRCDANLTIPKFADFAYVFVDSKYQGTLTREYYDQKTHSLQLSHCFPGMALDIIVENQGRQTFESIIDHKGILSDVLLGGQALKDWVQCGIDLSPQPMIKNSKTSANGTGFFVGILLIEKGQLADTFIDTTGWGKGVILVNGFNLGRYWATEGPQMTLYVPATLLKEGSNTIIVLQIVGPTSCNDSESKCSMKSVDKPNFTWKTKFEDSHLRQKRG